VAIVDKAPGFLPAEPSTEPDVIACAFTSTELVDQLESDPHWPCDP
jgi:hypothetical protein